MGSYSVQWDRSRVSLPRCDGQVGWTTWDDSEENLKRFIRRHSVGKNHEDPFPVRVVLRPRPDNEYNPAAISVCAPPEPGSTAEERHLGYISDGYLKGLGMGRIPSLSRYSRDAEIECWAWIEAEEDAWPWLDLPSPDVLRSAIDAFLGAPSTPDLDSRPDVSIRSEKWREGEAKTADNLRRIMAWDAPAPPVHSVRLITRLPGRRSARTLSVRSEDGRELGSVVDGLLCLIDERDREGVSAALVQHGVRIAGPAQRHPLADQWTEREVPLVRIQKPQRWIEFSTGTREHLAEYNGETKTLFVEDRALAPAACLVASRAGIVVQEVQIPHVPWQLEFEFDWQDRVERTEYLPEPPADFEVFEQFVAQRSIVGAHNLTGAFGQCRLCSQRRGAEFEADVCNGRLTYCHQCLSGAQYGISRNRGDALAALAKLGDLEFDGQPMLEEQLSVLHVDPSNPVDPMVIDRMLALRQAIRRRQWAWTHLLVDSGLAPSGVRLARGTAINARDGHRCSSLREKAVDDFLHQHGIEHSREPMYPAHAELNPLGRSRGDWLLADGTFVELWGMPDDPAYAEKMSKKTLLAETAGLRLVGILDEDLPRLPEVFADWLPPGEPGRTTWRWSPQVLSRAGEESTVSLSPHADPSAPGGNALNATKRAERLARCAEVVALQEDGLNTVEIAKKLGIARETVKILLRDGKFYANPASDSVRLGLAQDARAAMSSGVVRAEFQSSRGLSGAKSKEAWKDADVLLQDHAIDAGAGS